MGPYFKEYALRLFRRHSRDIVISSFLYFLTMYLFSIGSEFAPVVGFLSLLFYVFLKKIEFRQLQQTLVQLRNDSLLLPLSPKEMFFAQMLRTFVTFLPRFLSIACIIAVGFFDRIKLPFFSLTMYGLLLVSVFTMFSTLTALRPVFFKISWIQKFTRLTRFIYYIIPLGTVVFLGGCLDQGYSAFSLGVVFYVLAIFIVIIFLSFQAERFFLHEHKIYNGKNFKWFDVPGALLILFFFGLMIYGLSQPSRGPSSIKNIKTN